MPLLSRTFVKAGLVYFILALFVGTLMLAQPVLNLPATLGTLYPVYLHLLMVGWVTELIIGVAYWMFPKLSKEQPRGNERLGWSVFFLLNAGLILRAFGEPLTVLKPEWNLGWTLAVSALLQLIAGWAFIYNTWGRVKER